MGHTQALKRLSRIASPINPALPGDRPTLPARRPQTPRCPRTTHRWHVAWCLAMGLPLLADGFLPVVLCRSCAVCGYGEVWAGEENVEQQRVRLQSIEEAG